MRASANTAKRRRQWREASKKYREKHQAKVRAALYKWRKKNPSKVNEIHRRYYVSEKGRRKQICNQLKLPASAPDSLLKSIKLLRALKKEIRT